MQTYIKTYGCTLNRADSDIMQALLSGSGICIATDEGKADVIIINTCTVKRQTQQRILDELREIGKTGKAIVVAGCLAGASPNLISQRAPGASLVSPGNVHRIVEAVEAAHCGRRVCFLDSGRIDKLRLFRPAGGVIARIPTGEGCLSSCSFCETKFARGSLKSFSEELIIRAISDSVAGGAREIQLTSQDMGAYGADTKTDVARLMDSIRKIEGDFSVRIGMLNPDHIDAYLDGIIRNIQDRRFYRFLHLPVQSGSGYVAHSMGRRCSPGHFAEVAERLRTEVGGITIETDLIAGYPTESEADFEDTVRFVKEVKPDITNISKFGVRPHARAAGLTQLDAATVKERSTRLSRTVREIQNGINSGFVGKRVMARMTELGSHSMNGKTDSYKQVVVRSSDADGLRLGERAELEVYAASANALYCRPA